ncbi:MAG: nucleotidyltransferase domain-containing protein, partial [Syntrophales bacterium]|nr:nucleotidyltransferase domain-containing protein [Syntrophales bacterium]
MTERQILADILQSKRSIVFSFLFGSQAKGYANQRSDWDIAVYFSESPEKMEGWPIFELEAELSRAIGSNVQIITLNTLPPPVLGFQIIHEGQILTDKQEDRRLEVTAAILRQYHDWQYYQSR